MLLKREVEHNLLVSAFIELADSFISFDLSSSVLAFLNAISFIDII